MTRILHTVAVALAWAIATVEPAPLHAAEPGRRCIVVDVYFHGGRPQKSGL